MKLSGGEKQRVRLIYSFLLLVNIIRVLPFSSEEDEALRHLLSQSSKILDFLHIPSFASLSSF